MNFEYRSYSKLVVRVPVNARTIFIYKNRADREIYSID